MKFCLFILVSLLGLTQINARSVSKDSEDSIHDQIEEIDNQEKQNWEKNDDQGGLDEEWEKELKDEDGKNSNKENNKQTNKGNSGDRKTKIINKIETSVNGIKTEAQAKQADQKKQNSVQPLDSGDSGLTEESNGQRKVEIEISINNNVQYL